MYTCILYLQLSINIFSLIFMNWNTVTQKQHACILDYLVYYNFINKDKLYGMQSKEPYNSHHYRATTTLYSQNHHKNYTFYSFTLYVILHWINSAGIFVIVHGLELEKLTSLKLMAMMHVSFIKWKSPILQWVVGSTLKPLQEKWH